LPYQKMPYEGPGVFSEPVMVTGTLGGPEPPIVNYRQAGVFRRFGAFMIDQSIAGIAFYAVFLPACMSTFMAMPLSAPGYAVARFAEFVATCLTLACIYLVNHVVLEGETGRSVGRWVTRTQLCRKSQQTPVGMGLASLRLCSFCAFTWLPLPLMGLAQLWSLAGVFFVIASIINIVMVLITKETFQDKMLGTEVTYRQVINVQSPMLS
jgi:uncharacterized RDD family membrane protein YckC